MGPDYGEALRLIFRTSSLSQVIFLFSVIGFKECVHLPYLFKSTICYFLPWISSTIEMASKFMTAPAFPHFWNPPGQ